MKGINYVLRVYKPEERDLVLTTSLPYIGEAWFKAFVLRAENLLTIIRVTLSMEDDDRSELVHEWNLEPMSWKDFWSAPSKGFPVKKKALFLASKHGDPTPAKRVQEAYSSTYLEHEKLARAFHAIGLESISNLITKKQS